MCQNKRNGFWTRWMAGSSIQDIIAQAAEEKWEKLDLSLKRITPFLTSHNPLLPPLITLPESIGNLSNLTSLNLSDKQLTTLPESIGNLSNLTSLNLHINQLTTLPESIGNLSNLTSLDLSGNQLTTLPESIGNLSNLTSLDLTSNQLQEFPESIGNLQSLKELKATKNQLVSLPLSLVNLEQLSMLTISSNKLDLPPEIARKRKPEKILDFLRQQQEEGIDYIYEAKLLVVGEGGAGKTSLAHKLIDPEYELKLEGGKDPEKSTEGIDVLRLDFTHSNGNSFRINLWDFGGQEIYHATHQFFLTKRSLYLLVADTRQDNTDFNYWLEVIELLSEASPTLIVKNEKQDRPCQINENQLYGRFASQLKTILATNLATNRGLSEILAATQHQISQLPHIGNPLPKTWVSVREALETDQRNYITQTEFLKLCDTHGFKRRQDKLQLSSYLHDLGVCLHFQDDPVLKNWIILKPEWGTTAVYTVLDTPSVQQSQGSFTHDDLTKIWADEQYADMRDELLQLMMRFKLCYEIPHRPRTYIAPQLLSPNQPEYDWDDTDNLILRYHYEFMPKGMLTRFSVEMHKLIDSELIWKDGVILTDGNARAEVIENYYKSEIRIRISGKLKKPLREKVRHEFDKIHASYNNPDDPPENHRLRYQEYIPCNCSQCKGSQTPYSYPLKRLEERLKNNRQQIECDNSYEMVSVRNLIDDAIGDGPLNQPLASPQTEASNPNQTIIINAGNSATTNQSMSNTIHQHGQGDNYAGDNVHRDKIGTQINNSQDLAQATRDIKALFTELDQTYDKTTPVGQTMITAKTVEAIEGNPTVKKRLINAVKEGGAAALEEAIEHPAIKPVVAAIKGYIDA
ncbi:MAG: COR domain-containing protein [Cyanobacteria bacterium P01_D01_bin.105]